MQTLEQMRARDRRAASAKGPVGLGGWLILPLIGMLVSPVISILALWDTLALFGPDYVLTTQQAFATRVELTQTVVMGLMAPIGLLVLFFRRMKQFPSAFIFGRSPTCSGRLLCSG